MARRGTPFSENETWRAEVRGDFRRMHNLPYQLPTFRYGWNVLMVYGRGGSWGNICRHWLHHEKPVALPDHQMAAWLLGDR